jgi:sensor histidine kinase YesM
MTMNPILATMGIGEWLLLASIVLGCLVLSTLCVLIVWHYVSQARDEVEWNNELIAAIRSVRRGITSIQKRLDGSDERVQQELSEAKRLILDVESRLTNQITETREVARETRAQVAKVTNIHGGQNNLGNNSIGGGQSQQ